MNWKRLFGDRKKGNGFTLIELLIVIAIILILIAIALPNFLEAQIRARVTRAKGEIRSIGIAMESYFLDFQAYPAESEADALNRGHFERGLFWLTSPIAYMSSMPIDPFGGTQGTGGNLRYYETGGCERSGPPIPDCGGVCLETWVVFTNGPDHMEQSGQSNVGIDSAQPHCKGDPLSTITLSYSATNGTKSHGDIFLWGGDGYWIGVCIGSANKAQAQAGNLALGLNVNHQIYLHRLPPPLE
jgi:type II secretion system protein G